MANLKHSDRVTWKSHGGTPHGGVECTQTEPTVINGHNVAAAKEQPQYIVRSDNGGKAAHKRAALRKA